MKTYRISTNAVFVLNIGVRGLCVFILMCVFIFLPPKHLSACAMSAVITTNQYTLDDFPTIGPPAQFRDFNDPWDYFAFVMHNSNPYSNDDGYGVVAYRDHDPLLPQRQMWHKRVQGFEDLGNVWYTGSYLDYDATASDLAHDVFDDALFEAREGGIQPAIALCHARNASGFTLGNHPFWFELNGRSYTFMHNGNCNSARSYMITRIQELHPELDWFLVHPSNHFQNTNPLQWVDTEVLFHYLMSHIVLNPSDPLTGVSEALNGLRSYLLNPAYGVFNFIMSDGERLYAFRSSPLSGTNSHYKLSYRTFPEQFYGIRTLSPSPGDIELQPRELVVFSRDKKPRHYPALIRIYPDPETEAAALATGRHKPGQLISGIAISPNPFKTSTTLRISIPSSGKLKTTVYNAKGQAVWHEEKQIPSARTTTVIWDGNDDRKRRVSPGLYFIKTEFGGKAYINRVAMLK